jgi:hypothetical protein
MYYNNMKYYLENWSVELGIHYFVFTVVFGKIFMYFTTVFEPTAPTLIVQLLTLTITRYNVI